ncbi:MAG: DEAD/DEAH box helicase, partial [Burkholderiales bacterium]
MKLRLPHVYAVYEQLYGNSVRQIASPSIIIDGSAATFKRGSLTGHMFVPKGGGRSILCVSRAQRLPRDHDLILGAPLDASSGDCDCSGALWLRHPRKNESPTRVEAIDAVRRSWTGAFSYVAEDPSSPAPGLRPPQLGAVHAIHAHWAVTGDIATVVMPTGTGKTDTMLSILVSGNCTKVLVIVPTDALRAQLATKFMTLGILKSPGSPLLKESALYPIVCMLRHVPKTVTEVDEIFAAAQVVVMTSAIASHSKPAICERMRDHCSHLFVDEAHHAE